MNDIPQEGLGHDDWDWTAARLRGHEDYRLRAGFHTVVSAAVHVASGEVAGYTELMAVGRPSTVLQEDTGVVRGHRGHGLGLLLKVANLRALLAHAPQTRTVVTWNAETNAHMLAVNNLLGFRSHSRWEQVTAPLPVP
jgi:GNAT superfamily N-acetyltransferase